MQTANVKPPITQSVAFYLLSLFLALCLTHPHLPTDTHLVRDTYTERGGAQMLAPFVYQSCQQQVLQHGNYQQTVFKFKKNKHVTDLLLFRCTNNFDPKIPGMLPLNVEGCSGASIA